MPHYEFTCHDCDKPFTVTESLSEYEKGTPPCPHCGGNNVEQTLSSGYAVTSKKSA